METVIQGSTLESLRAGLRGTAYAPGEEGYDEASRAWNLNAHQHPALVVMAEGAADVMAAVRFAREEGTRRGGDGDRPRCGRSLRRRGPDQHLPHEGRARRPRGATARVEAGALWTDVIPEAQAHGLAGLVGSTSHVGVVGYTMGGGFGWLGRKYGFNAASIREADVVTADGELLRVSADEHPISSGGSGAGAATSG